MQYQPECNFSFTADPIACVLFGEWRHEGVFFQDSASLLDRYVGIQKSLMAIERPCPTSNPKKCRLYLVIVEELQPNAHAHSKLYAFHVSLDFRRDGSVARGDQEPYGKRGKISSTESVGKLCCPAEVVLRVAAHFSCNPHLHTFVELTGGGDLGIIAET